MLYLESTIPYPKILGSCVKKFGVLQLFRKKCSTYITSCVTLLRGDLGRRTVSKC